jgi:predicted transcriptional regulator
MKITKITIIHKKTPQNKNINELLLTFGESLGLFSSRDKDKSCYRIFIILIKALKLNLELTSDEIALKSGLTRGTVIHHLNHLMEAGIVTNVKNKYFLNVRTLTNLVEQMRNNVDSLFLEMEQLAKNIDDVLELN